MTERWFGRVLAPAAAAALLAARLAAKAVPRAALTGLMDL